MKGGHDLGGQQGMGPIAPEPEAQEPVFHAEWERRVFALTLATGMLGRWNIDESRHARERQDPLVYVQNSYYENWLAGIEALLVEKGLVDAQELQQSVCISESDQGPALSAPDPKLAEKILSSGASSLLPASSEALYAIGDRVRVRRSETAGHTRAPKYAQGAIGVVAALRGCHSYPDSNAAGHQAGAQLYTLEFRGEDLWGPEATASVVCIDLWEPYLVEAEQ